MSYQVLARKWRPRMFSEMVGQTHVLQALINALDNDRLHHAYLFTGTRGVGKTTIARIFAKSLNCESGVSATPCGNCSACREIDEGRFVDLIEVDAASRTKVEDTRELLENVQYAPSVGRYKVYLIDEVHMFSTSSFNALLKTLEEPPPHVKFLLATTDPKKLPVTILSRCLQFNLKRLAPEQIESHIEHLLKEEQIDSDEQSRHLISMAADGSLRDALSLLDQAVAYGGGELKAAEVSAMLGTIDHEHIQTLLAKLVAGDGKAVLHQVRDMDGFSPDYSAVLSEVIAILQRMAVCQVIPDSDDLEDEPWVRELASAISPEDCQLYYQIGLVGLRDLYLSPSARSGFEMVLLRMLAFSQDDSAMLSAPSAPAQKKTEKSVALARPDAAVTAAQQAKTPVEQPAGTEFTAVPATPFTGTEPEWRDLIATLGLNGFARELANHCVLVSINNSEIHLHLSEEQSHMHKQVAETRLKEKLDAHFGRDMRLRIEIAGAMQVETPAITNEREKQERLAETEQALRNDPFVQAVCERFDATLDTDTITPVVDSTKH